MKTTIQGLTLGILPQLAMLSAVAAPPTMTAALRTAMTKAVSVDKEAGVIKNAAVMSVGPAAGVGFRAHIDATTIAQLCDHINSEPDGVLVHLEHPDLDENGQPEEQIGVTVGRLKNCRIDGETARGDVHIGSYASKLPGKGDVKAFLLDRADEDPASLGLSAVFAYNLEPVGSKTVPDKLVARISKVFQVDFVEKAAANKKGLLSDATPITQPNALGVLSAVVEAAQNCITDARACIDAAATLSATPDAISALLSAAGKAAAAAQSVTLAARVCVDHCNQLPRGTLVDADTANAASAALRVARLCSDTCSACQDAVCGLGWGTSDLARACAAASPLLRTCRDTIWQVQDSVRPLTAPMAALAAQRMVKADTQRIAYLTK